MLEIIVILIKANFRYLMIKIKNKLIINNNDKKVKLNRIKIKREQNLRNGKSKIIKSFYIFFNNMEIIIVKFQNN